MSIQEWQEIAIEHQIDPLGALVVLSFVGCLLAADETKRIPTYPNGCPILSEDDGRE